MQSPQVPGCTGRMGVHSGHGGGASGAGFVLPSFSAFVLRRGSGLQPRSDSAGRRGMGGTGAMGMDGNRDRERCGPGGQGSEGMWTRRDRDREGWGYARATWRVPRVADCTSRAGMRCAVSVSVGSCRPGPEPQHDHLGLRPHPSAARAYPDLSQFWDWGSTSLGPRGAGNCGDPRRANLRPSGPPYTPGAPGLAEGGDVTGGGAWGAGGKGGPGEGTPGCNASWVGAKFPALCRTSSPPNPDTTTN